MHDLDIDIDQPISIPPGSVINFRNTADQAVRLTAITSAGTRIMVDLPPGAGITANPVKENINLLLELSDRGYPGLSAVDLSNLGDAI